MGLTATDIELAVARHLCYRRNLIVPNVSWGFGLKYEADMVILRPSGFAVEVEIKTNAADILRDLRKKHQHDSKLFREVWFAVPSTLADDPNIPVHAGILSVESGVPGIGVRVRVHRRGRANKSAPRLSDDQRRKLMELAAMRVWSLKERMQSLKTTLSDTRAAIAALKGDAK